jgi:2',3'-cyclic-nucleotide 2'-phosphodiesterase (5'-nucleotidase family)
MQFLGGRMGMMRYRVHALFRRFIRTVLLLLPLGISTAAVAQDSRYVLLTLLHTNDIHARVLSGSNLNDESRGGLARLASLVKQIRAEMPNVLLFDSGDWASGTVEAYLTSGRSIAQAINSLGYNAVCIGNHEFDWGQENARELLKSLRTPVVCANLLDAATGKPWGELKPYLLMTVNGVRIAVFGLITLETLKYEWPSFLEGLRFEDPIATAAKLVPELRKQADLVILLSHLGLKLDQQLAAAVPGIDIILGGHSHDNVTTRMFVGNTLIAQTGYHVERLGRVDLILKKADRPSADGRLYTIESINGRGGRWWGLQIRAPLGVSYPQSPSIPIDGSIQPDEEMLAAYEPHRRLARRAVEEVLTALDVDVPDSDGGAPGDTPLSRFLADRLREATDTEIALVDGKVRGRLQAGPLTAGRLWSVLGGYTAQNVVRLKVKGSALLQALEQWAGAAQDLAVGVSGLRVVYSPARPAGERILEVKVNGEPLDPEREYTVSGLAYVIQRFQSLMSGSVLDNHMGWSRELISKAVRGAGGGVAADPYPRLVSEGAPVSTG